MNKRVLANLKNSALYVIMPLMMVACGRGNKNTDANLADVETQLSQIDDKLIALQAQTDTLLMDSLKRDARTTELAADIKRHQQELQKLGAPKDSIRAKKFRKKIKSLKTDSTMHAYKIKENIIEKQRDDFRKLYREQDVLRARRDSLMKFKSR